MGIRSRKGTLSMTGLALVALVLAAPMAVSRCQATDESGSSPEAKPAEEAASKDMLAIFDARQKLLGIICSVYDPAEKVTISYDATARTINILPQCAKIDRTKPFWLVLDSGTLPPRYSIEVDFDPFWDAQGQRWWKGPLARVNNPGNPRAGRFTAENLPSPSPALPPLPVAQGAPGNVGFGYRVLIWDEKGNFVTWKDPGVMVIP